MKPVLSLRFFRVATCIAALFLAGMAPRNSAAQSTSAGPQLRAVAQANRVATHPDLAPQAQLSGHLPAWVRPENQVGTRSVDTSGTMAISVVLRRDPTVQAAFEKFLADQQDPASPLYHQWLTPQQVGDLFGPTASDLAAITDWLTSQGLKVDSVAPSHLILDVSGPAIAVGNTFRTNFGYFNVSGATRLSATSEPSVPLALSTVILSISGLTEMRLNPLSHSTLVPMSLGSPGSLQPQYSYNGSTFFLTPGDFNLIYDINPVFAAGNTGATVGPKAQHIAVIGRSRVQASDLTVFETNTNSALGKLPNVIIPGNGIDPAYPGTANTADADDQGEATLDVMRTLTTAPGAVTDLIVSGTPATGTLAGYDGIYVSASWNVNTVVDPVMSISFGNCELLAGAAGVNIWDTMFSSAAAEGISVLVSSGDSGAAGCAPSFTPVTATYTDSINYICSSSYATCVGGTEFNDASSYSTYWGGNGVGKVSALSYIPEGAWNEPATQNSSGATIYVPAASGGGFSTVIAKPTWQTGTGVPADGHRDVPDVAFSASAHDGYYGCLAYSGADCSPTGYFSYFSGTSAAAPGMAGIAALLNTKLGKAQGNLNPLLYKLAGSTPAAFHDVTVATSGVGRCSTNTPSMCNNSAPGPSGLSGGVAGYLVGTGYDEVTGLGSLDVNGFLNAAANSPSFSLTPTAATLTLAAGATSGNTDTITLASVNNFAGSVVLTCAVTNVSGTAAGTCSISPTPVALVAGGTQTSSLTITPNGGAGGTLNVTVTGTSGTTIATSGAVVVTVTSPSFTVTPAATTLSLAAGATTGNTDVVTFASTYGFAGNVDVTCSVQNASGSAAGTCSVAPTPITLAAGGSATSTLTILANAGTGGALSVVVTGKNGSTVVSSSNITVMVTTSSFTITAASSTLSLPAGATTANTDPLSLASINGFTGTVALTCSATTGSGTAAGACSLNPTSATLIAGGTQTSTLTITPTAGTFGTLNVTVTGTSGATVVTSTVAVTVIPYFLSASAGTLQLTRGATTGNTETITVTSNGLIGNVGLACSITPAVAVPPTCAISPSAVTFTGNGTQTATLTITTSAQSAGCSSANTLPGTPWKLGGGVVTAFVLILLPFRRRKAFRGLLACGMLAFGLAMISGCGGGGTSPACSNVVVAGTTQGNYTVTVTGTSGSATSSTSFALTVQ